MERSLYLFWHGPAALLPDGMDFHGDAHQLTGGMWLVRSDLARSKLYHKLKWQLPEGTPLMVTPLADDPATWPKFKGAEPVPWHDCAKGCDRTLAGGARRS